MDRSGAQRPRALRPGELAIVVRLRFVLRDRAWHPLPELLASADGFSRPTIVAVLGVMIAMGQVERAAADGQERYRFAPRPGRVPFTNRPYRCGL